MASNQPGRCCALGHLHEGTPSGENIKIGKIDAYFAKPTTTNHNNKTLVVYLPDIIGIWQNSKLMADAFAAEGFACVVVDLFNGDPGPLNPPEGFDLMGWLQKGSDGNNPHGVEQADAITAEALQWAKQQGYTKIGAAGYCFGAKYCVRHYKNGIGATFLAHPSFVDEEELAAITGPLAIAAAQFDDIFPTEKRHKSEEVLAKTGVDWQIFLHSGVQHGFAVRGDMTKPNVKRAKEQAFKQAVEWFESQLSLA
ncbi:dienelactone hydrolase [Emericellopsis atlantica]|uniref:Dienelactone hydrolase n=1 Tax=Emericellopsis atlantica TaxID=2614577 RepID=A0A9P7ZJ09_9HYPO|nr:dienelactone hydrolase [Emericellopsis atlantica]KAG9252969.1 dienelactone hydrolase [Emericellopsis atlantica]